MFAKSILSTNVLRVVKGGFAKKPNFPIPPLPPKAP